MLRTRQPELRCTAGTPRSSVFGAGTLQFERIGMRAAVCALHIARFMPKKRTIPILFLLLCTCGVEPATERPTADPPTADPLTISYESLAVAERAVIDHERATAKDWVPVHEGFARAVREAREAGR